MSATLTWYNSGNGTKTGTAIGNLFADMVTLINAVDVGADFSWEHAGSNTGSTPYYIVLKPKSGAAGRILIVAWSSAPAGNNAAILDTTPQSNQLYIAYFPSGNVNTASNLTASSGTIMGDDTDCTKVATGPTVSAAYGANFQAYYFDSAEACVFGFANPASAGSGLGLMAAGNILIDAADTAYVGALGFVGNPLNNFGTSTAVCTWQAPAINAGANTAGIRTNYGSSNRIYFQAWTASGAWGSSAVGSTDILTSTAVNKAWFVPFPLLGQTKGEGFILKLRQIAIGPGTVGPFTAYNTTGPVVQARQFSNTTGGGNGFPWVLNFKI